jgi:hypothetical protein
VPLVEQVPVQVTEVKVTDPGRTSVTDAAPGPAPVFVTVTVKTAVLPDKYPVSARTD